LLIEKAIRIHYCTPPSWFHTVNRLDAGSQGLILIGFGFANGMRNPMNPKPVSVSVYQMEHALSEPAMLVMFVVRNAVLD